MFRCGACCSSSEKQQGENRRQEDEGTCEPQVILHEETPPARDADGAAEHQPQGDQAFRNQFLSVARKQKQGDGESQRGTGNPPEVTPEASSSYLSRSEDTSSRFENSSETAEILLNPGQFKSGVSGPSPRSFNSNRPSYQHRRRLDASDMVISPELEQRLCPDNEEAGGPASPRSGTAEAFGGSERSRQSRSRLPLASTGTATNVNIFRTISFIKTRIDAFRAYMHNLPDPTQQCVDRGVHIETVYDFYSFGSSRVRRRRMHTTVFHKRFRSNSPAGSLNDIDVLSEEDNFDDDHSNSQESELGLSLTGSESPRSSSGADSMSLEHSLMKLEELTSSIEKQSSGGGEKNSNSAGSNPRKEGDSPVSKMQKSHSATSGSSMRSTQSSGVSSRGTQPGAQRKKKDRSFNNPEEKAMRAQQNAIAHWGVLGGKLIHTQLLDFQTAAQKAIRVARRKRVDLGGNRMNAFKSVRERARLVAKQAWNMSRRVATESADTFDRDWMVEDHQQLLVQLFSTELMDTLVLFANATRKILSQQPTLVEIKAPARVFGDIHGQFRDLLLLFAAFGSPDEHDAPMFVFNGDFVDRGVHSLEVIGLLMALKILLPERVWLIRGNHEDRVMNKRYGFLDECVTRLGEYGKNAYSAIHKVFDYLPLACVISDRVLVLHGGIGQGRFTLDDIRHIRRPMKEEFYQKQENNWVFNLLWSDPIEDDDIRDGGVFGVHDNPRGDNTASFGWNVTKTFCARHGLSLIVRSHQSKHGSPGFDVMHDSMLMRIFSARDYEGHGNDGAVLLIQESDDSTANTPQDDGKLSPVNGIAQQPLLRVRAQVLMSTTKAQIETERRVHSKEETWESALPASPPLSSLRRNKTAPSAASGPGDRQQKVPLIPRGRTAPK
mmetsp:Transcript_2351/g.4964  ORF Transcript_2351/g.4964 Transcript_2351/m.4964 type:complete len:891 (-) Transcript_2351:135-2807(-)